MESNLLHLQNNNTNNHYYNSFMDNNNDNSFFNTNNDNLNSKLGSAHSSRHNSISYNNNNILTDNSNNIDNTFNSNRRSSYIADSLIHNPRRKSIFDNSNLDNSYNFTTPNSPNLNFNNTSNNNNNYWDFNNNNNDTLQSPLLHQQQNFSPKSYFIDNNNNFNDPFLNDSRHSSFNNNNNNTDLFFNNNNTHNINSRHSSFSNDLFFNSNSRSSSFNDIFQNKDSLFDLSSTTPTNNLLLNNQSKNINTTMNTSSNINENINNGLKINNNSQLYASNDLKKLYKQCGSNYFCSDMSYNLIDHIKNCITNNSATTSNDSNNNTINDKISISRFLLFLRGCNLNYFSQPTSHLNNNQSDSNTFRVHTYRPLCLVTLKNGKIELLSTPLDSNLKFDRGDLLIIDGDRGKDLALVIEPKVSLDLALIINFLKKKIHFDSLITKKILHYPNNKFIKALIESIREQNEKLNSKFYDVLELTQLVIPSKQVLRFATPWEVTTNLHNKFQDELKALQIAQLKIKSLNKSTTENNNTNSNNNSLNIQILSSEFQFDRKKLTFYYICDERNDFRELIKELFKFYKARIWLCAIPNNLDIYSKYYKFTKNELKMYQKMMQNYADEDDLNSPNNNNTLNQNSSIAAPPLNELKLDHFQIGVYKELVSQLFTDGEQSNNNNLTNQLTPPQSE